MVISNTHIADESNPVLASARGDLAMICLSRLGIAARNLQGLRYFGPGEWHKGSQLQSSATSGSMQPKIHLQSSLIHKRHLKLNFRSLN